MHGCIDVKRHCHKVICLRVPFYFPSFIHGCLEYCAKVESMPCNHLKHNKQCGRLINIQMSRNVLKIRVRLIFYPPPYTNKKKLQRLQNSQFVCLYEFHAELFFRHLFPSKTSVQQADSYSESETCSVI